MKVQVSLDDELVNRIDSYADANYMSRSGLISYATTQFLNQSDVIMAIKNISLAMSKIADTGNIDEETMQQLKDYERMCKMFTGSK